MSPNKTHKKQSHTCIAVVANTRGKIFMGGDRRVSWGFHQAQAMPIPKISKRDGFLLGGTGNGYICGLIIDILEIPKTTKYDVNTITKYMNNEFKDAIYNLLINQGFTEEHNLLKLHVEDDVEILACIFGKVFSIIISNPDDAGTYSNGYGLIQIEEVGTPYATGCGGAIAWGALLENNDLYYAETDKYDQIHYRRLSCKERLIRAITQACVVSPGCGLPVDIISE